jgi:hypothetical protein
VSGHTQPQIFASPNIPSGTAWVAQAKDKIADQNGGDAGLI